MQISESHCGPAVTQMLLSNVGIEVSQEAIAEAGGATSLIELQGMRVDQLALAVKRLAPAVMFYYKDHATLAELAHIINEYRYPVGVEWQGVFEDEDEPETDAPASKHESQSELPVDSESEDTDYGHYSLVVQAYRRKRQLIIADPYKDYFSQARIFSFAEFDRRWYDFNEVIDPHTGRAELVEDDHMMFVVVRKRVIFPRLLEMRRFENLPTAETHG